MSTNPHSISAEQNLGAAVALMDRYKIRHLPVLNGGRVMGILSDRDIKFALSFSETHPNEMKVSDIAREEVYVVKPDSKLAEVVSYMATRKLGSAVVMDNEKLVGIFTAVDGLTALADVLDERSHGGCCSH